MPFKPKKSTPTATLTQMLLQQEIRNGDKEQMDDGQYESKGEDNEGDQDDEDEDDDENEDEDERNEDGDEGREVDGDGREEQQDKPPNLQRNGVDGEIPNKRPRISTDTVDMRAKRSCMMREHQTKSGG